MKIIAKIFLSLMSTQHPFARIFVFLFGWGAGGGVVGRMAGAGTRNLTVGRMQTGAPSRRPGSEDGRGGKPSVQAASTDASYGLCCRFPHINRI